MSWFEIAAWIALPLHLAASLFLAVQGLHSLWLAQRFLRSTQRRKLCSSPEVDVAELPVVLVQLPVYRERDVVARVLESVGALDWPRERLRIQLLDDSDDDTAAIGAAAIAALASRGVDAVHVHRADRKGYKAGALAHGLALDGADPRGASPFVAIFDADFVPRPDFLRRALPPLLERHDAAFLQGRWDHLNAEASWLTRAQSIGIDGHFAIEQGARAWSGLPLNFNGTCGVWRRAAIEDSGGWQHDTLTEDLDLSYRAHLRGWTALYDPTIAVPGELPPTLDAWRAQQFRWAKGSLQTARKLLPSIWRATWSVERKLAATLHLSHYLVHPAILATLLLAPFAVSVLSNLPALAATLGLGLLLSGLLPPLFLYVTALRVLARPARRALALPALMSFGAGIALSNSRAAWQALASIPSPFVRTPKHGAGIGSYRARGSWGGGEIAIGVIACLSLLGVFARRSPWFGPILALYAVGFFVQGSTLLRARWQERLRLPQRAPRSALSRQHWLAIAFSACAAFSSLGILAALAHAKLDWRVAPLPHVASGLVLALSGATAAVLAQRASAGIHRREGIAFFVLTSIGLHLLATAIPLSDDVRRYSVEGHQILRGENPYAVAPQDTRALDLRSLPGPVNHAEMTAIYPPPMLGVHAIVVAISAELASFRWLAFLSCAAILALLLALRRGARDSAGWIAFVGWHPVLLLYATGEAHHDALAAAVLLASLLALERGRPQLAIALASAAALLKPFALAALPAMLLATSWRHLWIPALLGALSYAPFASAGEGLVRSLRTFGGEMHFHGPLEPLLRVMLEPLLSRDRLEPALRFALVGGLVLGIAWLLQRRREEPVATRVARSIALALLCLPTLHPWYFTVLVALLPFARSRALCAWTLAAPLYQLHGYAMRDPSVWAELPLATAIAHVPFVLWMLAEAFVVNRGNRPPELRETSLASAS